MYCMDEKVSEELGRRAIMAVLEIEDANQAVPVARALVKGGVSAIELALRTPASMDAIERIAKEVPEMMIGVGTIIEKGQCEKVKKLGASFGVAPGFNPNIVKEALNCGLPFAPGISTPSEIEGAIELGCKVLKLFPAEPLGGLNYLKSINAPYNHLHLKYIPLGGVNLQNLGSYASFEPILAIGGTWIAKKDSIRENDYDGITKRAQEAVNLWKSSRN